MVHPNLQRWLVESGANMCILHVGSSNAAPSTFYEASLGPCVDSVYRGLTKNAANGGDFQVHMSFYELYDEVGLLFPAQRQRAQAGLPSQSASKRLMPPCHLSPSALRAYRYVPHHSLPPNRIRLLDALDTVCLRSQASPIFA